MKVETGYEPLAEALQLALNQSQHGKGKDRHANDKPILQQPIMEIGRMVGPGYNIGQAMKKGQEAMRLPTDRAQAELLGAIIYLAAAYLLMGESKLKLESLDFTLPSITLPGDEAAVWSKYYEEREEWDRSDQKSMEGLVELWDCVQVLQTHRERGGHSPTTYSAYRKIVEKCFSDGLPIMEAKKAMLIKNAARGYYSKDDCSRILGSNA